MATFHFGSRHFNQERAMMRSWGQGMIGCAAVTILACARAQPAADGKPDLTPAAPAAAGAVANRPAVFTCNDSLQIFALFTTDSAGHSSVALAVNDDRLHLPQLRSADGARYGDSTAIFWNKGDSATFDWRGTKRRCGGSAQ
ncbi:MAG TPA: MliC family protein [Gemmatimonadales bacterium]